MSELLLPGSVTSRQSGCICPNDLDAQESGVLTTRIDLGCPVHRECFNIGNNQRLTADELDSVIQELFSEMNVVFPDMVKIRSSLAKQLTSLFIIFDKE